MTGFFQSPCEKCGQPMGGHASFDDPTGFIYICPKDQAVPRVARSLADLRVGQTICPFRWGVWQTPSTIQTLEPRYWDGVDFDTGVVILSDPPATPVTIPAEVYQRLRDAVPTVGKGDMGKMYGDLGVAAYALIEAVERNSDA